MVNVLREVGIHTIFKLWYSLPKINEMLRHTSIVLTAEKINAYADLGYRHYAYVTKQVSDIPPHLHIKLFRVDMLEAEIDSELWSNSPVNSDESTRDVSEVARHQVTMVTHTQSTNHNAQIEHLQQPSLDTTSYIIMDSGADCHVGGKHWMPLTPTEGPTVCRATVRRFCKTITINSLPIVEAITKATDTNGHDIIIRSACIIYDPLLAHLILSTYALRESGAIVDDVSRRHTTSGTGSNGTQAIYFGNGTKIPLSSHSALMIFHVTLPTYKEYIQALSGEIMLIDIGLKDWNPQIYDDVDGVTHITDLGED